MFAWFSNLFSGMAYTAAVSSAGFASHSGLHQAKEPARLQELAAEKRQK